ncbi:MAG: WecB/TagA/CpsF family glycosyl transferase [Spirochaetes bacterium]|nr:MAG: WecB/TagA/CpsF family glycosyl transferase [Spirochaetota bacterium]
MESLELNCLRGCLTQCPRLRFDLPSEAELALLSRLWGEGYNHQITFLRTRDIPSLTGGGEYASMVKSSDLVLPSDQELVGRISQDLARGELRMEKRHIQVSLKHQVYLAVHRESQSDAETAPLEAFKPLSVLSILLSALAHQGGSLFLVGGRSETLRLAEANLKSTFPGLRVVGRAPGDYKAEEEGGVVVSLQKSTPNLVLVGSMVPEGELWVPRHMRYTAAGLYFYEHPIIEILAGRQRP